MLRLPSFRFLEPGSLKEASLLLAEHGPSARLMAGGTDLLPSLKFGLSKPDAVIHLGGLSGHDRIDFDERGGLRVGALARLSALERDSVLREKYPALAHAAASVGSPQLREMGTVGGNLNLDTRCEYYNQSGFWRSCKPTCVKVGGRICNALGRGRKCFAVFSGDLAPVLMALDARVELVCGQEERVLPLGELYTGDGARPLALRPGEILKSVEVPAPESGAYCAYARYSVRKAIDFPLASVAVALKLEGGERRCRSGKVVIGAVGPRPIEVKGVGQLLDGEALTPERVEEVSRLAFQAAKPVANRGSTPSYRRRMVKALVKKVLLGAER